MIAADLLAEGGCSAPCLLGSEEDCQCRCGGVWHGVLLAADLPDRVNSPLPDGVVRRRCGRCRRTVLVVPEEDGEGQPYCGRCTGRAWTAVSPLLVRG